MGQASGGTDSGEDEEDSYAEYYRSLTLKQKVKLFLDGVGLQSFLLVLNTYALFGDDFKLAVVSKDTDYLFEWITFFVLVIFMLGGREKHLL